MLRETFLSFNVAEEYEKKQGQQKELLRNVESFKDMPDKTCPRHRAMPTDWTMNLPISWYFLRFRSLAPVAESNRSEREE